MWVVKITKPILPIDDPFRIDFFPRVVRYREQAQDLVQQVHEAGGQARIVRLNLNRITARQVGGDDGYQWAVFIDGKEMVNGLKKSEVPHYRKVAEKKLIADL